MEIGIRHLAQIKQNWQKRLTVWNRYDSDFMDLSVTKPTEVDPETRHAYHL
jgi:dTDP-4-amino-4,6-dideoxygalactose transaminase